MDKYITKMENIASEILLVSRDTLIVRMRFLDVAISRLKMVTYSGTIGTDGRQLFYNPIFLIKQYKVSNRQPSRCYLHLLFHCVFQHPFIGNSINRRLWNLACDIAVESVIHEMGLSDMESLNISKQLDVMKQINKDTKLLTAEKIYRYLREKNISKSKINEWEELFTVDDHEIWYGNDTVSEGNSESNDSENKIESISGDKSNKISSDNRIDDDQNRDGSDSNDKSQIGNDNDINKKKLEWKEISARIQMDLETFSKEHGNSSVGLIQNLKEVNREKYDYETFLKKFAVLGEAMKINDDEFDYIFYTYGLTNYQNMPLIEPLEYKEVKKIKEFVIAIDTSGSVWDGTVQRFLNKTYNILKSQESFFSRINIHIIQCDAEVQEDYKICSSKDFDYYLENMNLKGGGGTDFRPVFEHVNKLTSEHEFVNLKGLIYFTDGCGTFPESKPDYNAAFVFVDNDYNDYSVPPWAMKLILREEDI